MLSIKICTTIILSIIIRIESSGLHPVVHAPAISYVKSIPYNIPPFAASVNVFNRYASPVPRPILHSPPLLTAAPVAPQLPYFPLAYPQARSIHPPSVVAREVYPGQIALPAPLPGALPGPLPLPGAYPGPFALPGPLPLAGPLPAPGPFPLPGSIPHPGLFTPAGPPNLPAPFPYPEQVPVPEPLPHPVIANSLNPAFPAFPNVNPYATPFVPPTNVLAPPYLKR